MVVKVTIKREKKQKNFEFPERESLRRKSKVGNITGFATPYTTEMF